MCRRQSVGSGGDVGLGGHVPTRGSRGGFRRVVRGGGYEGDARALAQGLTRGCAGGALGLHFGGRGWLEKSLGGVLGELGEND